LPAIPPPTDADYRVKKPTQDLFDCCCNEFWWMSLYVAKGLWRNEILYAMDNLNHYLRPQLMTMVSWHAGLLTDFSTSVGKCGKYLNQFLPDPVWQQLLATFPNANVSDVWLALHQACRLFDTIGRGIGQELDLTYPAGEADRCRKYLDRVQALPGDAESI
jgi:aminoglycoside 6-adenylyltransferase